MSSSKTIVGKPQFALNQLMVFADDFASLPAIGNSIDDLAYVRTTTGVFLINRNKRGVYRWTGSVWEYGGDSVQSAANSSFDNTSSGLSADTTQDAIDEIEGRVDTNDAKVSADGTIDTHSDVNVTTTAPIVHDHLRWDGSNWVPVTNFEFVTSENQLLSNTNEVIIGTPVQGAEFIAGKGDNYTEDMVVFTFTSSVFANVSTTMADPDSGTVSIGTAVNDAIYFGSDQGSAITHPGIKIMTTVAKSGGTVIAEYWDGLLWSEFNAMCSDASGQYFPHGNTYFERINTEQIRYDHRINSLWDTTDPMSFGTALRWVRFRVTSVLSTAPTFQFSNLHTDHTKLSTGGFIEYFGTARPIVTIPWDIKIATPVSNIPASQDIFLGDKLDLGRIENSFVSGVRDRITLCAAVPSDMDTSYPLVLNLFYQTDSTTGNIVWVVKFSISEDGDSVFRSAAAAPGVSPGETTLSSIIAAPATDTQTEQAFNVELPAAVSRNSSETGSLLWLSLERAGNAAQDTFAGDVNLIQIRLSYMRAFSGGHV